MPLRTPASIYRRRVVGNPWLYHIKWWAMDVAAEGKVRARIEAASLRDLAGTFARSIPFSLRIVRDLIGNKIRSARQDR